MRWVTCRRASAALPDRINLWGDGHLIAMGFEGSSYRGGNPIFFVLHMALLRKRALPFWAECRQKPFAPLCWE